MMQQVHKKVHRIGRYLELQAWLERDAESSRLVLDTADDDPLSMLQGRIRHMGRFPFSTYFTRHSQMVQTYKRSYAGRSLEIKKLAGKPAYIWPPLRNAGWRESPGI